MAKLHADHPPAESFWWHLEGEVMRRRRKMIVRTATTLAAIVAVVAAGLWVLNTFFPPDPNTIALVDATNRIQDLVASQKWEEALQVVQVARERLPDEPELAVWQAVLFEQLGDKKHAASVIKEAQQLMQDRPIQFWLLLGNDRLVAGNMDGAEVAGQQAVTLNPQEAQAYFLLGGIAEARNDVSTAIDMFDKTFQLAEQDNPQLAVIAKVRMGQLMQRAPVLGSPDATPAAQATPTP